MKLLAGRDEVMWLVVRWRGEYYSLVVTCHVTWCDVIACVVSCQCGLMVMSCYLLCPAMGWNVMSLRCHWLWGHVVWFEVVLWRCGDPKYYSVLQSIATYYSCTTKYYPSKYRACHPKWIPRLIRITYETSFTMRGAAALTLQPHQILRLPRKMTPQHHQMLRLPRKVTLQHHQMLRLPRKMTLMVDCHCAHIWKRHLQSAEQQHSPSNISKILCLPLKMTRTIDSVTYETSCTMRGATGSTLKPHQILRLHVKLHSQI